MYSYRAYNLRIDSDLPLPELMVSSDGRADVTIKFGKVEPKAEAVKYQEIFLYHFGADEAHFFWDKVASFRVSGGNEITVEPCVGVEAELLRLLLLGAVFSVLLYQRGLLVLHASAVAINGCGVAFIGNKGWGKSTIAAAFYGRGHQLIADDLVAIEIDETKAPTVLPGFPQIKLWPEAAIASLGDNPEMLPRVASGYEKRARRVQERFSQAPLPLKAIFTLGEGIVTECNALQPQEAVMQLIGNSHITRFAKQALRDVTASKHLRQCAQLADAVPVYRLNRPNSLELLPEVTRLVEVQMGYEIRQTEVDSLELVPQ